MAIAAAVVPIASFLGRTAAWSILAKYGSKFGGSILNLVKSKVGRTAINTGLYGGIVYGGSALAGASINKVTTPLGLNKQAELEAKTDLLEASQNANPDAINGVNESFKGWDVSVNDILKIGGIIAVALVGAYFIVNGKK